MDKIETMEKYLLSEKVFDSGFIKVFIVLAIVLMILRCVELFISGNDSMMKILFHLAKTLFYGICLFGIYGGYNKLKLENISILVYILMVVLSFGISDSIFQIVKEIKNIVGSFKRKDN